MTIATLATTAIPCDLCLRMAAPVPFKQSSQARRIGVCAHTLKDQAEFTILKSMLEVFDIMNNPDQFRHALNMAVEKRADAIAKAKGSAS